jgi:hypothetical protein
MALSEETLNPAVDKVARIIDKFDEDLVASMIEMSAEELREITVQSQQNLLNNETRKAEDTSLVEAKRKYDFLLGPYKDAKKFQEAKIKMALYLLKEFGDDD